MKCSTCGADARTLTAGGVAYLVCDGPLMHGRQRWQDAEAAATRMTAVQILESQAVDVRNALRWWYAQPSTAETKRRIGLLTGRLSELTAALDERGAHEKEMHG